MLELDELKKLMEQMMQAQKGKPIGRGEKRCHEALFGALCENEEQARAYLPIQREAFRREIEAFTAYEQALADIYAWHQEAIIGLGYTFTDSDEPGK